MREERVCQGVKGKPKGTQGINDQSLQCYGSNKFHDQANEDKLREWLFRKGGVCKDGLSGDNNDVDGFDKGENLGDQAVHSA